MKTIKQNPFLSVLLFVTFLIVLGCGGGGGGVSTTSGTTSGSTGGAPVAGQYLEFFDAFGSRVDPLNLTIGQNLTVEFVNYDTFGTRTKLSASFTKSGPGSSSVTLTPSGGLSVNSQPAGLTTVSGTATVSGQSKTVTGDVNAVPTGSTATLRGRVMSSDGVTPVTGVQVELYDTGSVYRGGAVTGSDGRFTAVIQTSARSLTMKASSIPSTFYKSIKYQNNNYPVSGLTCPLTIPALTNGQTYNLPANLILPRQIEGPPPPPSGCS